MPVYATRDELYTLASKKRIVTLSDDTGNGASIDAVVDLHLDNAEGEINAALAKAGYAVPVATPLPAGAGIVKTMTLWIGL